MEKVYFTIAGTKHHYGKESLECDDSQEDTEEEDGLTELELAGINPNHLEYMGEKERRTVLEAAGLDPEKFDF